MVSGQWPVKCDAEEITVIESAEANLLLVLVTGTLRLSTNQAQIELENEPISGRRRGGRTRDEWPAELGASGEPFARHKETCGRTNRRGQESLAEPVNEKQWKWR